MFKACVLTAALLGFACLPLSAQGGNPLDSLTKDPWLKPLAGYVVNRVQWLINDPASLAAFAQANADDFSPGFFKTELGYPWRSLTQAPLDNQSYGPFSHRFQVSFNPLSVFPSAQLQFHALPEGRWWPQVTLAFSAWTSYLNFAAPQAMTASGIAPRLTLSKSIRPDAKLFLGYQVSSGNFTVSLSNASSGLVPDLRIQNYLAHELLLGTVLVDRHDAEYAVWIDMNLTRQELYIKAERSAGALTLGLGFYPDHLLGVLPLPYARIRVRL